MHYPKEVAGHPMKTFSFSIVAISLAISGIAAGGLSQMSRASIRHQVEAIGIQCDDGDPAACRKLALVTGGQCAAPEGSGCRYTMEMLK